MKKANRDGEVVEIGDHWPWSNSIPKSWVSRLGNYIIVVIITKEVQMIYRDLSTNKNRINLIAHLTGGGGGSNIIERSHSL